MNGKLQKFLGWFLFFIGLTIIGWTLYSSYNIFLGKKLPAQIFKIENKESQLSASKKKVPPTQEEIEEQIRILVAEQLKELIPKETLNTLLNLIAWSIFAGILIFAGTQIASLGIKIGK